jgi:hypothetical protein
MAIHRLSGHRRLFQFTQALWDSSRGIPCRSSRGALRRLWRSTTPSFARCARATVSRQALGCNHTSATALPHWRAIST